MSRPRFVVRTVTGYATDAVGNTKARQGVSAHVCDSLYLYEVAGSYRSEAGMPGARPGLGVRVQYGVDRAIAAAEAHAARLNRDTA